MKGNFKLILMVIFVALAIFGIMVFAGLIKIGNNSNQAGSGGTVVLWGTEKNQDMAAAIDDFNKANPTFTLKYVQKYPETFDTDLLEALASGTGPDLFFISDELAYKYSNKIYTIPYTSYPLATFKNNFARAGEVFLTSKGLLAFPLTVDPLVMYYNRSMLDTNNIVYPPATWDDLQSMVPTLTQKDASGKIVQSAVAMGQFSNVTHAKDILATLFMQAGNPIVYTKNDAFLSALGISSNNYDLGSVLKFYTDFADPLNSVYSWNRSLENSQDAFSAENLTFYFGYASELATLISKNPNENFMVAPMPQVKGASTKLTYAHVTGIAISSASKNFTTAFTAASFLATGDFAGKLATISGEVPVRRDLLAVKQTDAYTPIFYSSALYGSSWLDPSTTDTDNIFQNMVESVLSNNMTVDEAVRDASGKLDLLFAK